MEDSFMEIGDFRPLADGRYEHKFSGHIIDVDGRIWSPEGELVFDPEDEMAPPE